MPSLPMTLLAAGLVAILYSLVPAGRCAHRGKWVAAGAGRAGRAGPALPRRRPPTDVLVGVALGVAVPLLAFRWFTPNEVFPVTLPARAARPTSTWAAPAARRSCARCTTSWACVARGQALRPGRLGRVDPAADHRQGRPGDVPVRQAVRQEPPALGPLVQARPHAALRAAGGREAVQHRPPAGPVRGLRAAADARGPGCRAPAVRVRGDHPGAGVPAGHRVLRRRPRDRRRRGRRRTSSTRACGSSGELWEAGLAHRDIKPANLLVRDGRLLLIDVRLRRGPAEPVAAGRRPGQHDAGPGAAQRAPSRSTAGPGCSSRVEEITEAFAATRGLTMPSQLRRMMRAAGTRPARRVPAAAARRPPRPISVQRWTGRRLVLLAATVAVLVLAYEVVVGGRADPLRRVGDIYAEGCRAPSRSRCGCSPSRCPPPRACRACGPCRPGGLSAT